MKKFTLAEKMTKEAEMKKLEQQVRVLCTQQHKPTYKVEELQAETGIVINIIHPIYKKVWWVAEAAGHVMPKHINFDLVKQLQKE